MDAGPERTAVAVSGPAPEPVRVHTWTADLQILSRLVRGELRRLRTREPVVADQDDLRLVRQLRWYVGVGIGSTVIYALLYIWLQPQLGVSTANAIATLLSTAASVAGHRWLTFARRGREGLRRELIQTSLVSVIAIVASDFALDLLLDASPTASTLLQITVSSTVTSLVAIARFLLLRHWVFRTP